MRMNWGVNGAENKQNSRQNNFDGNDMEVTKNRKGEILGKIAPIGE